MICAMRCENITTVRIRSIECLWLAGLLLIAGCQTTEPQPATPPATQPGSQPFSSVSDQMERVKEVVRVVDVTGTADARGKQTEMMEAIRKRVGELDVEGFNRAVAQLNETVKLLTERIAALTPEMIAAVGENAVAATEKVRLQIEQAKLGEAIASMQQLTQTLKERIEALDIEQANKVLIESNQTATAIRESASQLNATLATARTTFRIIIAVVLVFGVCALVWLVRFLPSTSKRGRS
jgi:hypothetical protein